MKILVGCEYSGRVRDALIKLGHEATSCDFLPTESPFGNTHTHPHYQGDVRDLLTPLKIKEHGWDGLIVFPDCTYLCSSGLHWNNKVPGRQELTERALDFVRFLLAVPIEKIALENPVGCISTCVRKWDQIIHPNQFGHSESKTTCIWLKNLPLLKPTKIVPHPLYGCKCGHKFVASLGALGCPNCNGSRGPARPIYENQTASGQNKLGGWDKNRAKKRALTYQGIADAMAQQWWGKE